MLEEKLHEALARYNQINKYVKKMIMEQEIPSEEPPVGGGAPPLPGEDTEASAGDIPAPEVPTDDTVEPNAEANAEAPTGDAMESPANDTEEIDITDLVNMTKSIKKDMEEKSDASDAVLGKMDDVFKKLDDLESRIGEMDAIIDKIDQLGYKVEKMKEPTPEEKLQLRSLDSYPFNKTTDEFFNEKMPEMEKTGKNEYVITPDEVEDYSKDQIKDSFNAENEEDEDDDKNFKA